MSLPVEKIALLIRLIIALRAIQDEISCETTVATWFSFLGGTELPAYDD